MSVRSVPGLTTLLAIVVVFTAGSVSAGLYNETFADYAGMDAIHSRAKWDVFNGALSIHPTPYHAPHGLVHATALPSGGFAALYIRYVDEQLLLVVQRYDSWGNPMWNSPRQIAGMD
ncbi:MAG TPA: hypothetical protein PLV45_13450, partial [bacterium]|nr:hypothetical protein [bacterium]